MKQDANNTEDNNTGANNVVFTRIVPLNMNKPNNKVYIWRNSDGIVISDFKINQVSLILAQVIFGESMIVRRYKISNSIIILPVDKINTIDDMIVCINYVINLYNNTEEYAVPVYTVDFKTLLAFLNRIIYMEIIERCETNIRDNRTMAYSSSSFQAQKYSINISELVTLKNKANSNCFIVNKRAELMSDQEIFDIYIKTLSWSSLDPYLGL
jgi:hypothetical protein